MEHLYDTRFEEARQLLDDQRYSEAAKAFSEFIDMCAEAEGAYGNRGLAYINLGEDEQAIEDFRMVVSLNENDAMGYAMMAEACKNLGRHEDALKNAVSAMELDSEEPTAHYIRGWLFAQARQYEYAIEDLNIFVQAMKEPDEVKDLLEACELLCKDAASGNSRLSNTQDRERLLSERGVSFNFSYQEDYAEKDLFCPYAHCIRNMPRRADEAPSVCPVFGFECPGGSDQACVCGEDLPF